MGYKPIHFNPIIERPKREEIWSAIIFSVVRIVRAGNLKRKIRLRWRERGREIKNKQSTGSGGIIITIESCSERGPNRNEFERLEPGNAPNFSSQAIGQALLSLQKNICDKGCSLYVYALPYLYNISMEIIKYKNVILFLRNAPTNNNAYIHFKCGFYVKKVCFKDQLKIYSLLIFLSGNIAVKFLCIL